MLSSGSKLRIEIKSCGGVEHRADLTSFAARGLMVPHQYSSWPQCSHSTKWRWCRALDEDGQLVTAFAVELLPSRLLPFAQIGRIDRIGRSLHAGGLHCTGDMLTSIAMQIPRLLRLDVRVFDEDPERRGRLRQHILHAGGRRIDPPRDYTHTLLLPLQQSDQALLANLSRRTRQDVQKFLKHPGTRIIPISDSSYLERIKHIHQSSYTRTGAKAPSIDVEGMLRDTCSGGESLLVGAYMGERQRPDDLIAFAWGRLHGDHAVYEAGGLEKSATVRHLSPAYALLWRLMSWARSRDATWFDLGGIIASDCDAAELSGITAFKRRFSNHEQLVAEEFFFEPDTMLAGLAKTIRAATVRMRGIDNNQG